MTSAIAASSSFVPLRSHTDDDLSMKPKTKFSRRELMVGGATALTTLVLGANHADAAAPTAPVLEPTGAGWPARRKEIERGWLGLLGDFPKEIPALRPVMREAARENGLARYHVKFHAEDDDVVTAWLLVPDAARQHRTPAIICLHSTTFGSGKDMTVGLAGRRKGDPPLDAALGTATGLELARHGFVTLSIDLLNDGERITGERKGDSRAFYRKHPEWSVVGKNTWDVMRSVDFLQTLDFVDRAQIGCIGWSLGGHSTLFAAAFDSRITAAISNGGVLDWHHRSDSWSRSDEYVPGPNAELTRRFGFPVELGPNVLIKKARPYIAGSTALPPADFDQLMMMVAPRPLMIISSEWEFYSHKIMPKCVAAARVYAEWRDAPGLPSVVEARKRRLGHDRTLAYYAHHNRLTPEQISGMLEQVGAGDCFGWFSFPGGHSYPGVARRHTFAWFDRWLGRSLS